MEKQNNVKAFMAFLCCKAKHLKFRWIIFFIIPKIFLYIFDGQNHEINKYIVGISPTMGSVKSRKEMILIFVLKTKILKI